MSDEYVERKKALIKETVNKILKYVGISVIGIIAVIILMGSWVIVPAGHRGVLLTMGAVDNRVLGEGFNLKMPIVQSVIKMNVQTGISNTETMAASKDLQEAHSTIALNYHIDPTCANKIYKEIGVNYEKVIIDPAVQEVMKAITAKYTAVELIQQRETVSTEIKLGLRHRLGQYHMLIDDFSMKNFNFSKQFSQAIEEKQTAEQKAAKAKNDLERIKIEAEQKIASARAEAESLRLQKSNISPELLQLRQIEVNSKAIEKWDGKLPVYTGGTMPFIDVNSIKR